ncbi:SOS response-associated peptidase [Echinicola vietnamensis]|uniref:Abasic site processing protein n=1 Tax=Echinicola vietnamensis (strain DSM 17526 / LMG 23754 / KMM 6221) TaxID=926556 RepID=L0G5J2_ECHVK|nr:SOS response-associated peptidase [Echinicola vietnamensis]AGA80100.1 hypothetical protein Echvi_3888 [Echinicola vietnamensis DSM 17526]
MCERYSLATTKQDLESRFEAEMLDNFQPRYNIAPTQLLPIITSESPRGFSHFYWGVTPEFSKNKPVSQKYINAKAETVHLKASSKSAFQRRRCIIPADGYYMWKKVGKKTKIPYRITFHDKRLFSFAGIWEEFESESGKVNHTFSLLTTEADALHQDFGDRMPVILERDQEKIWLDKFKGTDQLLAVLHGPDAGSMTAYTVSQMVNQINVDAEFLLKKTGPMDQFGNYTLFG